MCVNRFSFKNFAGYFSSSKKIWNRLIFIAKCSHLVLILMPERKCHGLVDLTREMEASNKFTSGEMWRCLELWRVRLRWIVVQRARVLVRVEVRVPSFPVARPMHFWNSKWKSPPNLRSPPSYALPLFHLINMSGFTFLLVYEAPINKCMPFIFYMSLYLINAPFILERMTRIRSRSVKNL